MTHAEIAFLIAAVVIIVLLVLLLNAQYRTRRLKQRYGPEYSRAVRETGSTSRGEAKLRNEERRVARFHILPLTEDERQRFTAAWAAVQRNFVDDPTVSLAQADRLIHEVMTARCYPTTDFDQSASDISVDHPNVVEQYRAAHLIYMRQANGSVSTEELRRGMVHYRALFDDLLGNAAAPAIRRAS